MRVVVPSYRLVWYNKSNGSESLKKVVVPSYRLVWYNTKYHTIS